LDFNSSINWNKSSIWTKSICFNKYVSPCIHSNYNNYPCLNNKECTLNGTSNQWYRFILAGFWHAGIIHLLLNIFAQILIAGKIVSFRIAFIYLISGIFGFIFGPEVIAKLGFSGSIFSLIALSLLHLIYNWKIIKNPKRQFILKNCVNKILILHCRICKHQLEIYCISCYFFFHYIKQTSKRRNKSLL